MQNEHESPSAGWYRNPNGVGERWWDGSEWTEHVRTASDADDARRGAGIEVVDRIVGALYNQGRAFWFSVLGLLLILVGSVAPWARALLVSINGTDGDGVLFLIAAAIALPSMWAYASKGRRRALVWPILTGVGVAADSVRIIYEIENNSETKLFGENVDIASAQWGIYATLIGGATVALLGLYLATRQARPAPAAPSRTAGARGPRAALPRLSIAPRTLATLAAALGALLVVGGTAWALTTDQSGGDYYTSVDGCVQDNLLSSAECERLYGDEGFFGVFETAPLVLTLVGLLLLVTSAAYLLYRRRTNPTL